jgi:hypothetical protein
MQTAFHGRLAYLHDIKGVREFKKLQFQFNYSTDWSLVHMYLRYIGGLLSLEVQPNNSQKNVCSNSCINNDGAGIPQVHVNQA